MIRNRLKLQAYTDGVASIYAVTNISAPPMMPKDGLTLKQSLRYDERTVGINRMYLAKQANVEVSYVLRCPILRSVSTQDIAIPNDGKQYRITAIQYPEDSNPPSMDLSLERLVQDYDIA